MKTAINTSLMLLLVTGMPSVLAQESSQTAEPIQHLENALGRAKTGDMTGTVQQIDKAKKEAILHEIKHPYHETGKTTSGEKFRRHHSREAFRKMDEAKASASSGDSSQTVDALGEAEKHLKNEEAHDKPQK